MDKKLNLDEALAYLKKKGSPVSETTIRKYARIWEKSGGKKGLRVSRWGGRAVTGAFGFERKDLDQFSKSVSGWGTVV